MTIPEHTEPTLHDAGLAAALRTWFGSPDADLDDFPPSAVRDMERAIDAYVEITRPTGVEKDCAA